MAVHICTRKLMTTRLATARSPCGIFRYLASSNSPDFDRKAVFTSLNPQDISPKSDDRLAGRKWLPGSKGKGFPEFLGKPRKDFPHALSVKSADEYSIDQLAQMCRHVIDQDLFKYGTILFRGLPLSTVEEYAQFTMSVGYKTMDYTGGSANRKVVSQEGNVYTSNDDPSAYTIELHNELAYAPVYPRKLAFFCLEEPGEGCGGYTVLCDTREFVAKLDPAIAKKIEDQKARYSYRVPSEAHTSYISWQSMFGTSDKKEVEGFLTKDGFNFSWDPKGDTLEFWITRPSFITRPETGEKIWFSHLHRKHISGFKDSPLYPGDEELHRIYTYNSSYGDGSEVEPEVLQHVRATSWSCTIGFQWKNGDVLFIDNLRAMHGRLGFTGKRKILATLMAD